MPYWPTTLLPGFALIITASTAVAQQPPVPGVATGTVDGEPFDVALDCSSWDATQRMVYSEGDRRGQTDLNDDGIAFVFSHFAPANATDGTLVLNGRTLAINAGFRPGPDDPQWEVTDTGASFSGISAGMDKADVSITIDCAPRDAVERGFTGRVTGTIDEKTLDAPLFCGNWDAADSITARTEEDADLVSELFIIRKSGNGTVEVRSETDTYQMVISPMVGTKAEITADTVSFKAEMRRSNEDDTYKVDLNFDCTAR